MQRRKYDSFKNFYLQGDCKISEKDTQTHLRNPSKELIPKPTSSKRIGHRYVEELAVVPTNTSQALSRQNTRKMRLIPEYYLEWDKRIKFKHVQNQFKGLYQSEAYKNEESFILSDRSSAMSGDRSQAQS